MKYSNCCGAGSNMYNESDLCPRCHEHCEFEDSPSELQTYLELRRQFREDKEARLKAVGLNWTGFQNLERRVVDSIPSEGVVTGKYRAVKEVVETHIIPSNAPLGPNKVRVVLHEERKKYA